jgi:hypothetical protein
VWGVWGPQAPSGEGKAEAAPLLAAGGIFSYGMLPAILRNISRTSSGSGNCPSVASMA